MLPTDNAARKALPLWTFLTQYFPRTFIALVRVSVAGNKQHLNEGTGIRWAREKSTDQLNTAMRHLMDYGAGVKKDIDGEYHLVKAIWRLSAQSELDIEAEEKHPPVRVSANNRDYYELDREETIFPEAAGPRC